MELKPGLRLRSQACSTEVVVVRGTASVDVRCGGHGMEETAAAGGGRELDAGHASGTLLGKRYVDADTGLELLCVKPGKGSLSIGDRPMTLKEAKPLPASD